MTDFCRICLSHSKQTSLYCRRENAEVRICGVCGHAFTESVGTQSVDYNGGVYAVVRDMSTLVSWFVRIEQRINFFNLPVGIKEKIKSGGGIRILDFGCGNGHFLGYLGHQFSVESVGVETSESRAKSATRKYGLNVFTEEYTRGKIENGNFDIIFLNHVLEHIENPLVLLKELSSQNMTSNGAVVIEVPNFNSLQRQLFGGQWMHLDIPFHLHHFTQSSLASTCDLADLEIIHVGKRSFLHSIYGVLSGFLSMLGFEGRLIELLKTRSSATYFALAILLSPVACLLALTILNDAVIRIVCVKRSIN